jgi:hypothetical protein
MPTKSHHKRRHHCQNLDDLKPLVQQLGYELSAASWEDDQHAYAFSVETHGPATLNHPKCVVHLCKRTGTLSVTTPNHTRF